MPSPLISPLHRLIWSEFVRESYKPLIRILMRINSHREKFIGRFWKSWQGIFKLCLFFKILTIYGHGDLWHLDLYKSDIKRKKREKPAAIKMEDLAGEGDASPVSLTVAACGSPVRIVRVAWLPSPASRFLRNVHGIVIRSANSVHG